MQFTGDAKLAGSEVRNHPLPRGRSGRDMVVRTRIDWPISMKRSVENRLKERADTFGDSQIPCIGDYSDPFWNEVNDALDRWLFEHGERSNKMAGAEMTRKGFKAPSTADVRFDPRGVIFVYVSPLCEVVSV